MAVHEFLPVALHAQGVVVNRPGYVHRAVVPQKAPHLAQDHRHRVGGKARAIGGVEAIDGLEQAHAAVLKQIFVICAPVAKAPQHIVHQRQVFLHQLVAGLHIARMGAPEFLKRSFVIRTTQALRAKFSSRTFSCFASRTVVPWPTADCTSTLSMKLSITVKPMPLRSSPSSVV